MENMNSNRKCGEIVHCKSPHNFWIRLEEYKNDYTAMISRLQAEYEDAHENPDLCLSDLILGSKCCVFNQQLFEWHRCEILIVNKSEVLISYIDLGWTDLVAVKSVKKLYSAFQTQPPFALHCSLHGINPSPSNSWSLEAINEFNKLTTAKVITVNIRSKIENVYQVDMFAKNVNIQEHLVKNAFGHWTVQANSVNKQSKISHVRFEKGKFYDITVSTIYSPFCFYAQINDYLNEFFHFESQLQTFYQNVNTECRLLANGQIGENCVAKFSEDQQWYRAVVKEVNEKFAKVFFVDYGNEDTVPLGQILKLDERFTQQPLMAIKCCLDGVKPPSDGFLEQRMQQVSDFMFNSLIGHVTCLFTDRMLDESHFVQVRVDATNLSDLLVQNSLVSKIEASPLKKIPIGKQTTAARIKSIQLDGGVKRFANESLDLQIDNAYEIVVTYIETFGEFYFKLKESDTFKNLNNNLKYFYEKKINLPQPELVENYPCVYYEYENKEWHRAKIVHVYDRDHCLVRLVDTGRTRYANRNELREIYEKFLEIECQSCMACLDGLAQLNDDEVDESILIKFKEIALNRSFLAKVVKKDKLRTLNRYWLNLFDESTESVFHILVDSLDNSALDLSQKFKPVVKSNLEETQVSMMEASVSADTDNSKRTNLLEYYFFEPLKIDFDLYHSINISNFDSKDNFHAQLNSAFGQFDQYFDEFQHACENGVRVSVQAIESIGDVSRLAVAAKFDEDNLWYRARILNLSDKLNVMLEFVDYGNCQLTKIEHVVFLNKQFSKYAPTSLKVTKLLYTEQFNLSDKLFQQLLLYANVDQTDQTEKVNWKYAMFNTKNELILDDFYALLYQMGILNSSYFICPLANDAILSNDFCGQEEGDILDVKLTNIEHGLKHIYFNLKSSMNKMEKMRKIMVPLIQLDDKCTHNMFLVKTKENLIRCKLLSNSGGKKLFFCIDYGRRACLEEDMKCYLMPPSLYQFASFAIHCRLTLADNIEKVWTREEKEKFYLKIKPGNEYQIKLLTKSQPFIVEFYDKNNQIDFQFNQIINRMVQTVYETQSIMSTLTDNEVKLANFVGQLDTSTFTLCAQSNRLFDKLVEFSQRLAEFVKSSGEQRVKVFKQGDICLSRTRSQQFLNSIEDKKVVDLVRLFYTRVLISEARADCVKIYYIDLGIEDTLKFSHVQQLTDYKFLQLPLQFKLQPQFLYELTFNKASYATKFNSASKHNDFIDAQLIADNLSCFINKQFYVDFAPTFNNQQEQAESANNQAELTCVINGKNLIDLVIEQSFTRIHNYAFVTQVSHINSIEDFYIQKVSMDCLLKQLQESIQIKVEGNKLEPLRSIETNKLCVAVFEDGLFYRAKIIGANAHCVHVFYIDYGNTSIVQIKDLREITDDLVDRFPRNFAINCRLDLAYAPTNQELELINSFFFELIDQTHFDLKLKTRLTDNKYNQSGFYLVDMFDARTKENVIDLFKKRLVNEINQTSCIQYNGTVSYSLNDEDDDDDKAIAECLNDDTTMNATSNNESIFGQKIFVAKEETWETTDINMKNYAAYDETLTRTVMEENSRIDDNENSELYSTANSSQLEKTICQEEILFKDCTIAFMHSSVDFFVQKSDFDAELEKIQPLIDNCLDVFDVGKSNVCIGQFKQDNLFYRCKILQWLSDRDEAFCELIDFGNRDYIHFETITKMSDSLVDVKPLALNCSLGFELKEDSQAYANLNDLVNSEIKFDCKLKSSLECNDPVLVELTIAKNGLKITKELLEDKNFEHIINQEIIKNVCDQYYEINSGCKKNDFNSKSKLDDDYDDDKDDQSKNKMESIQPMLLGQSVKTSTQVNMTEQSTQSECTTDQTQTNTKGVQEVLFFTEQNEDNSKNETSKCDSLIDRTALHPSNQTVDYFDESNWSQKSINESSHPNNETVLSTDDFNWSKADSTMDQTKQYPRNQTVHSFDQSNWSNANASLLHESNHPINTDASRFNDSNWTKNSYIAHSIRETSVWLDDPDQSGFVYTKHVKKTRSNLDTTRGDEEQTEYTLILNGYVILVNSLNDFYFQAEDADLKLMNMRHVIDKCEKKFDKPVKVGDLCVAKYHVDEQLYRAQILEVKPMPLNLNQSINSTLKLADQTVRIRYIDYGNEGYVNVSELFKCDPELKQVEPLALKCKLNLNKKLSQLLFRLDEVKKDTADITQYFKVLTGRSKVTVKCLKLVDLDLSSSSVDVFVNNENICDILASEAQACLSMQNKPSQPLQIKIAEASVEFNAHVVNLSREFIQLVRLKNLNILNKIDEFIESLIEQTLEPLVYDKISQCIAQVGIDFMRSFKLNQPYVRVNLIEKKKDQFECVCVDLDHRITLTKNDLYPSTHFVNRIQAACDKYDLQLNNSDCILVLSSEQRIHLQQIFNDLIDYEINSSSNLKVCVHKKKFVRLYNSDGLDINTILEMCINLLKNPLCGRVVHCEPDNSQFDILNELANNQVYKREMSKIYSSTGLFDYQIDPEDLNFKTGSMCLVDCGSSARMVSPSDSVLSLAEHVMDDEKREESTKDICRGVVMDEQDDKCVVLNLDTGKQLTVKKTRLRTFMSDPSWSMRVLEKIPYMLVKCKVVGHVERNSPIQRLIHKSRYYGEVIKLKVIDTWTHELDIKGLYKIVKIHTTDSDLDTRPTQQNFTTYYTLSHVNSLLNFYIHPHDADKQLKLIQEQIGLDYDRKKLFKNPPELGKIYAIKESDKYSRVKLLNTYVSSQTDTYQAFFIDYGYTKKISLNDLIVISQAVQCIAPQAICCRLHGWDVKLANFMDASQSINDSNCDNGTLVDQFKQLLENRPFQASIYKQWSLEKKIINFVPLQSDNMNSIEIVIHINGQNLIDSLKNLKQLKSQPKLSLNKEYRFKFINFVSSNEFTASLVDRESDKKLVNATIVDKCDKLSDREIRTGLLCVYRPRLARALVLDTFKIKTELNVKLDLIDYGQIVYAKLNDLCKIDHTLYDVEPLAYKINLTSSYLNENLTHLSPKELILEIKNFGQNGYTAELIQPNLYGDMCESKCLVYNQVKLELNAPIRVMLTNVDTAKHFGIVQSVYNEKRLEFIGKFHQWHKENKSKLVRLSGDLTSQPCAVNSIQVGKWSRGLVVECNQTANISNVYLIDFCKTLTVGNDRLYRIDNDQFLNEPSYVHRCFLQEEQEQLRRFSKYIDIIKTNRNDSSGLDNLEILIECMQRVMTRLHVQSNIENYQYEVRVLEVKRVKSCVPQSPNCMLNNSAKISLCHNQVNQVKYSDSFQDETTENILCSTYKENYVINESKCLTLIHSEHANNNEYQSDTFSAITESTRIQTLHDSDHLTLCDSRRREQTSNWILDQEHDEDKFKLYNNLSAKQKSVPVRVLSSGFTPTEFLCQRIELNGSYEKLQSAMNDYYEKIVDVSKSLEKEKTGSVNSQFSDSLDSITLFENFFRQGDYCAVYLGKSWARCLILELNQRSAMIECVDDGRKQSIAVNKLEKLADNFKIMPRYCLKCRFSGLDSKKLLQFDLKAIEHFERFLSDASQQFTADIIDVQNDELTGQNIYEIILYMNKENVLDLWSNIKKI